MMNSDEIKEVDRFLQSKKLPLDIYIEIRDHFLNQIEDRMNTDDIAFHDAFEEVKLAWNNDLELKYNWLSGTKTPKFIYNIMVESDREIGIKSIKYSILLLLSILILGRFFNNIEHFVIFNKIVNLSFYVFVIFLFIKNFKYRNCFKINSKSSIYTVYQRYVILYFTSFSLWSQFVFASMPRYQSIYAFVHDGYFSGKALFFIIMLLLMQVSLFFANFNFIEHNKTLKRIKKYIVAIR